MGEMNVGTRLVHDMRGSGIVISIEPPFVQTQFDRDGKIGTFDMKSEHLFFEENGERVHVEPKYVSVEADKITAKERARRLSKYCTDYEYHISVLGAEFDPNKNPTLLAEFEEQSDSWVLKISCGGDAATYQRVCSDLREHGLDNPENYIFRSAVTTNAEKYDLLVPDPNIPNIDFALGMFFNPLRLVSTNRYQIGRKEFALRNLLKVHILEIGEAIPDEDY